jgi:membrane protease YdiL (CAAX protease family)
MLAYPVLKHKERLWLALGSVVLGLVLGTGFFQAANTLFFTFFGPIVFRYQPQWAAWGPLIAAPALAYLFFATFRSRPFTIEGKWAPSPLLPGAFAVLAALAFGLGLGKPGPGFAWHNLLWLLIAAPLTEEWLFRGWVWKLLGKWVQGRFFSFTQPLPAVVVGTSLAFACWHFQNLAFQGIGLTLWQVFYTFFASVWLCRVRTGRGGLVAAVACHMALNAATVLGQLLR